MGVGGGGLGGYAGVLCCFSFFFSASSDFAF